MLPPSGARGPSPGAANARTEPAVSTNAKFYDSTKTGVVKALGILPPENSVGGSSPASGMFLLTTASHSVS